MSQPITGLDGHIRSRIGLEKIQSRYKKRWVLSSWYFRKSIKLLQKGSRKCSANQTPRWPSLVKDRLENANLVGNVDYFFFLSSFDKIFLAATDEKWKMLQPIRGKGDHRCWWNDPKNKNLNEDVESTCFLISFVEIRSVVAEEELAIVSIQT